VLISALSVKFRITVAVLHLLNNLSIVSKPSALVGSNRKLCCSLCGRLAKHSLKCHYEIDVHIIRAIEIIYRLRWIRGRLSQRLCLSSSRDNFH
jgi:hypothetical protein